MTDAHLFVGTGRVYASVLLSVRVCGQADMSGRRETESRVSLPRLTR